MQTKILLLLLTVALGLAAVVTYAAVPNDGAEIALSTVTLALAAIGIYTILTPDGGDAGVPTAKAAAIEIARAEAASPARVHVKTLVANLEMLGAKPALTDRPLRIEFRAARCPQLNSRLSFYE